MRGRKIVSRCAATIQFMAAPLLGTFRRLWYG